MNLKAPMLAQVKTASLNRFHRNPRIGNIPLIVESLERLGQYKPLVVNRGTKTGRPDEVLAGNQTLAAALKLGLDTVLVHWVDVDDDTANRIVLVDNRASDKGTYDNALLAELLVDLDGLDATGYSDGDLTRLLNGLEEGEELGLTDPDAVPALPIEPITKPGDVWILGRHRLICGDATSGKVLSRVADGREIDAMWTDPPYGVDYVGKTKDALTIQNDGNEGLAELLLHSFQAGLTVLKPGAPCYIAHADTARVTFEGALREAGYLPRQNLIWVKNAMVLGRSDYQYQHEPILEAETPPAADVDPSAAGEPEPVTHEPIIYGFTPGGQGRLGRGGDRWYGNNKQTTVFEVAKPSASRLHPTMKPVELITLQLRNSVVRDGAVLDLFAGSGSTLIAAFQLHLTAYLVELDPAYCDVICRRWEEHSGVKPILEGSEAVSFIPEEG